MTPFQKLRADAGLTQAEVAMSLGISTNNVSAWERSLASPRPQMWDQVAKAYGVTVAKVAIAVRENAIARNPPSPELIPSQG